MSCDRNAAASHEAIWPETTLTSPAPARNADRQDGAPGAHVDRDAAGHLTAAGYRVAPPLRGNPPAVPRGPPQHGREVAVGTRAHHGLRRVVHDVTEVVRCRRARGDVAMDIPVRDEQRFPGPHDDSAFLHGVRQSGPVLLTVGAAAAPGLEQISPAVIAPTRPLPALTAGLGAGGRRPMRAARRSPGPRASPRS